MTVNINYPDNFLKALGMLWNLEGGIVEHPNDKGGMTNYGISLNFYRTINSEATKDTIEQLTKSEVIDIYYNYFYKPYNYHLINNFALSRKLFITCVNTGHLFPNKAIQKICNEQFGKKLEVDGILGNESITTINELTKSFDNLNIIRNAFTTKQIDYYSKIIDRDPSQRVFLAGWTNRAKEF